LEPGSRNGIPTGPGTSSGSINVCNRNWDFPKQKSFLEENDGKVNWRFNCQLAARPGLPGTGPEPGLICRTKIKTGTGNLSFGRTGTRTGFPVPFMSGSGTLKPVVY